MRDRAIVITGRKQELIVRWFKIKITSSKLEGVAVTSYCNSNEGLLKVTRHRHRQSRALKKCRYRESGTR